jgi:hypothetical protein
MYIGFWWERQRIINSKLIEKKSKLSSEKVAESPSKTISYKHKILKTVSSCKDLGIFLQTSEILFMGEPLLPSGLCMT